MPRRAVITLVLLLLTLAACQQGGGRGERPEGTERPTSRPPTPSPTGAVSATPTGGSPVVSAPGRADCTLVLGFSVTANWYEDGAFESMSGIDGDRWELIVAGGHDVWRYANPDAQPYTTTPVSPCEGEPDRALFQVAALGWEHHPADEVVAAIRSSIDNIRATWPTVDVVELIPIVGGPDGQPCEATTQPGRIVDASLMNPAMYAAIAEAVNGDDVVAGPDLLLADCSQYQDGLGHITSEGSRHIASVLAEYYGT